MKLKIFTLVGLTLFSGTELVAQELPPPPPLAVGRVAEPKFRSLEKRQQFLERIAAAGGWITLPYTGRVVCVANDQTILPRKIIDKGVASFNGFMKYPTIIRNGNRKAVAPASH